MPRRIAIIFLAIIVSPLGIKCRAENPPAEVLACPPSALDVYVLPPTNSTPIPSNHLLVFEVQNIGKTVCSIDSPMIQLLPKLSRRDEFYSIKYLPDGSSADGRFDETVLSPGDWVHALVGWHSQGYPNWQCVEHSGLKLLLTHENHGTEPVAEASVEVRNLLMRSCIGVFVSEYRMGRYTPDSEVPDDWLKFPLADPSESPSSLKQTTDLQILHNTPLFQVDSNINRILLGRDFQIRLKREVQPGNGCDYRLLRMRDSDGTTVISLQNCEGITTRLSQGLINLSVLNSSPEQLSWIDMLPRHPGPVAYDAIASIGTPAAPSLAESHIDLVAHDPTPPAQAAIMNPVPGCTELELGFTSLLPLISDASKTLRAYEATNASGYACSVAGTPDLGFYEACPNCTNDLFALRPNGRIDLQPGQSAHFLVGYKKGALSSSCYNFEKMGFRSSSHRARVSLPFDVGVCGTLDVSAWREGKFDNDPMNLQWAKAHPPSADPTIPIPPDCDKPELLSKGRPIMIPMTKDLDFGLSLAQHEFKAGESIALHIWLVNTGNAPAGDLNCSPEENIGDHGIDIYDAYGHRLLSRLEAEIQEGRKTHPPRFALSSGSVCIENHAQQIPAHTCLNRDEDHDFTADLTARYNLPPGEYTVRPRQDEWRESVDVSKPQQEQPFHPEPGKDLTFSVVQP